MENNIALKKRDKDGIVIVVKSVNRVQLFVTPWTVTCQAPLSMGFPRQEYRSLLPFPSPEDLPGIKPMSPAFQAHSLPLSHLGSPMKYYSAIKKNKIMPFTTTWMKTNII